MAESLALTDYKDLRTIWTKKRQNRDPATSHLRQIHAFDTETYNGNIFLIADSDGKFLDKITSRSVINFLFHKKYEGSWNFFYNLTYDAEVILKPKRGEFSPTFYRRNTNMLRDYCIGDCILTKELSEKWIELFHNAFGFYPLKWVSSGYLAEKVLINHGIEIPTFDSIPYEIQDFAFDSNFVEGFKLLNLVLIVTANLYDIISDFQ